MKIHSYLKMSHPLALLLIFCLSLAWMSTGVSADKRSYTREDAEFIAKAVWGEARNCDMAHQAAVVWCILNRVDSALFPNTIREVVTQKHQFAGYHAGNPVDSDILALACDVLARWSIEPSCMAGVGRVLPKEYLYFGGNGALNQFRTGYNGGTVWDWSLDNPYEEQKEIQPEPIGQAEFRRIGGQNEKETIQCTNKV